MKNIFILCVCLVSGMVASLSYAQKRVVVLGSSTAYGYGATVFDSAWAGRLQASFRKNSTDGIDTVVIDLAVPGYVTYQSLPIGYPIPGNRPLPDPHANVTYVLDSIPRPDVVIINYPNNDIVNGYDPKEMMANLRVMFQQFNANGISCFISTSQPRNVSTNDSTRTILRQLVDSINNNFGYYAINFWNDLVTNDGTNMLRGDLTSDGIHPNNTGHRFLFQRVQAKNIFNVAAALLPLTLKKWEARLEHNVVKLEWRTAHEESNTLFEIQRSNNGKEFWTVYQINGSGHDANYSWTDGSPLGDKNFYRLKISEPNKTSYSRTIEIINEKKQTITSFYYEASQVHIRISGLRNRLAEISIINFAGTIVKKQTVRLITPHTDIVIPVSELASGAYLLILSASDGMYAVERFVRTK